MKFILIYITAPTKSEARRLVKTLITKRLIACGNISEIESFYWWTIRPIRQAQGRRGSPREGKIINSTEWAIIAKTLEQNFEKVKREIEKIHSYEIPCIIKVSATANEKYLNWVTKELKRK